jgi:hypothetical protein
MFDVTYSGVAQRPQGRLDARKRRRAVRGREFLVVVLNGFGYAAVGKANGAKKFLHGTDPRAGENYLAECSGVRNVDLQSQRGRLIPAKGQMLAQRIDEDTIDVEKDRSHFV